MEECIIIVPTFSQYIDVCKLFFELFKINWNDCPYHIVLSVVGNKVSVDGVETLYAGSCGMLTDAVQLVKDTYPADYYICLLGDNFIYEKINTELIRQFILKLKKDGIQYCGFKSRKEKSISSFYRNVRPNVDSYVFSFSHFIATGDFIDKKISGISDIDFEKKYHEDCLSNKVIDYSDVRIMTSDIFHLVNMCSKGKWFRDSYKFIKMKYPNLELESRTQLSRTEQLKVSLLGFASEYLRVTTQYKIKSFFKINERKPI